MISPSSHHANRPHLSSSPPLGNTSSCRGNSRRWTPLSFGRWRHLWALLASPTKGLKARPQPKAAPGASMSFSYLRFCGEAMIEFCNLRRGVNHYEWRMDFFFFFFVVFVYDKKISVLQRCENSLSNVVLVCYIFLLFTFKNLSTAKGTEPPAFAVYSFIN